MTPTPLHLALISGYAYLEAFDQWPTAEVRRRQENSLHPRSKQSISPAAHWCWCCLWPRRPHMLTSYTKQQDGHRYTILHKRWNLIAVHFNMQILKLWRLHTEDSCLLQHFILQMYFFNVSHLTKLLNNHHMPDAMLGSRQTQRTKTPSFVFMSSQSTMEADLVIDRSKHYSKSLVCKWCQLLYLCVCEGYGVYKFV